MKYKLVQNFWKGNGKFDQHLKLAYPMTQQLLMRIHLTYIKKRCLLKSDCNNKLLKTKQLSIEKFLNYQLLLLWNTMQQLKTMN